MYDRILVALDGSEVAERVLPYVEALAARFGSTVSLLRATTAPGTIIAQTTAGGGMVAPGIIDPTPIIEAERQEANAYLRALAERLRGAGLAVQAESAEGPADEVILQRAAELPAALVAMTTHGRGGFGRLVFGSVADAVLRHAPCPVLLVRVSDDEAAPAEERTERGEVPII